MKLEELLDPVKHDDHFRRRLLSQMQIECNHYLTEGIVYGTCLQAGTEAKQIICMKALWNSLPIDNKPKWLTYEEIETLEKRIRIHRAIRDYMVFEEETNTRYPFAKHYGDVSMTELRSIETLCEGQTDTETLQCAIGNIIGRHSSLNNDGIWEEDAHV